MEEKIKVLETTEKDIQESEKKLTEEMLQELSNNKEDDENGNTLTAN